MAPDRPEKQQRRSQEQPEEVLRRLERRLDEASAAAERLIADAARAAASGGAGDAGSAAGDRRTPPAGWRIPDASERATGGADLAPVLALLRSLRDLVPPDLQRRVAEALRELLLALRALIDWYLERLEQRRRTAPEVQDIPIQ